MIRLCAFSDEASESLKGQIDALVSNSIKLTELRSVDGINVSKFTDEFALEVKKNLDVHGIEVWSLGSPYGKVALDGDFSEKELFNTLDRLIKLCGIFGCGKIRMFSFFHSEGKEDKVFDLLEKSVKIASEYGIELCHENEKEIYGEKPENVLKLSERIPGLKLVYDPANFVQTGVNATEALGMLREKIYYYHIKDVIAETDEIVPAGLGDGKIKELVGGISGDTVLTLEPHLALFSGYSDIDKREMKNKFSYNSNAEAFAAAADALKGILTDCGYRYENGGYVK